jgi:hypothetical protein
MTSLVGWLQFTPWQPFRIATLVNENLPKAFVIEPHNKLSLPRYAITDLDTGLASS